MTVPRVLIIAGSDSSGGAGLQADLKTVSALGGFGCTAVTALTAQNTTGVYGVVEMTPEFVGQQIDTIVSDIGVDVTKTGMLSNASIIELVAAKVRQYNLQPLVVDPVMVAKSGARLLSDDAVAAYKTALLPLATVVTPNLYEAGVLFGKGVTSVEEAKEAARVIQGLGPRYVVVKGGDRLGDSAIDILFDGEDFVEFRAEKLDSRYTHGTGCIFASAIATGLGIGLSIPEAVALARRLITAAVSDGLSLGRGEHSPANPMALLSPQLYGE